MTDGQVTVLIAAITWIFAAGGFYAWCRASIASLKKEIEQTRLNLYRDINGIGKRVKENEDSEGHRYNNLAIAIVIAAPPSKESEIAGLLREGT